MKKLLPLLLFIGYLVSGSVSAQLKEPFLPSAKADDGVLTVYPNPAKDFVVLKVKNPAIKVKSVTFYSVIGIQVAEIPVNLNTAEIRLDRLRSGKFLMKYQLSDNTQNVIQIIKQ